MTLRDTSLRDRLACATCNWVLNHVASRWYRSMIGGSILYGLKAAASGEEEEIALLHRLEYQIREEAKPGGNGLDWELIDETLADLDLMRGDTVPWTP